MGIFDFLNQLKTAMRESMIAQGLEGISPTK